MSVNIARQNYCNECETFLNAQVNLKLRNSQVFASLSAYYDRDNVALPGLRDFYYKNYQQEREQAFKLISYQNSRGGRVHLAGVSAPPIEFSSAKEGLSKALELQKESNDSLIKLSTFSAKQDDPHLQHFIDNELLPVRVKAIKELADFHTELKLVFGEGIGLFLWDRELLRKVSA
ncbi:hypothetical protein DSO57_1020947 [Entomophthora muscae]|uniref:Uncharacterized protein n=1 Tax=Entomophthora muscae TaxID=34485 RepID=A0ACC2SSF2_9FUNG|nr:hypothetical protein DSO57_1020947 [Entomophthora muscae]